MCGKKRKENREGMGNEKSYDDEDMALETDM